MSDGKFSDTISLILTRLNGLDRILRIRQMEGLCGITTGGKKDQSQDELVGPLGSNPVKKKGSWVSVTDDSVKSSEEYFQRFDSMRLRAIENRQRDLESRLERLEKMML